MANVELHQPFGAPNRRSNGTREYLHAAARRHCHHYGTSVRNHQTSSHSHCLFFLGGTKWRWAFLLISLLSVIVCPLLKAETDRRRTSAPRSKPDAASLRTVRVPVVDGNDVRFARLSGLQNLSQVRVSQITQDDQGFIWFGTQNGLNRYDGYSFKVFKNDPENPESLSGFYIYSLFKDRSGAIWVGTGQFLDRFDPLTEKFRHYSIDPQNTTSLVTTVNHISEDSAGMLWLSTGRGLFRLNPSTGQTTRFFHDANDAESIGDNDVKSTGEDRVGAFWVATRRSLDKFDRATGKVERRIPLMDSGMGAWFHEDRFGEFWLIYGDGRLATVDRNSGKLSSYLFDPGDTDKSKKPLYAMLEDSKGTMWFGSGGDGLLKFDRERQLFIRYNNRASDADSLGDTRVTTLFEDREGNIWAGLHQVPPNVFATTPLPFEKFTYQVENANSLASPLVSVLYEDKKGVLWVGGDRSLKLIDRKTGRYSTFKGVLGNEILSIVEDGPDALWFGTAGQGLQRYESTTGRIQVYRHDALNPSTVCSDLIQRLLRDHNGTLWAATWDGLCSFDPSSKRFSTYRQDPSARGLNYAAIAEDPHGDLWLGSNLGLQHFEPRTGKFTSYGHKLEDPNSLSDNRVNSLFFDRTGQMWVGTEGGLDKFHPQERVFSSYGERDGMAGNVVSCILQDDLGRLWLSTNKGVSSFDPLTKHFNNYTVADGLPGADLTGWGACFKSSVGEMFFGGFAGATAFFPDKVSESSYIPPIVLTDFRLFGSAVNIGKGSPLTKSISRTDYITLSNSQNVFSIEFSALGYLNAANSRYRYMLDGLDQQWREVGGDRRVASYTTLPTGVYTFRVQAATSRGAWSEPGAALSLTVLPPWWATWWFRTISASIVVLLGIAAYSYRLRQIARQFDLRLEERVGERTRIARELHDTLLQSLHGVMFQFQAARNMLPGRAENAMQTLDEAISGTEQAIAESRDAIHDLRPETVAQGDLVQLLNSMGQELEAAPDAKHHSPTFHVIVEGEPRELSPIVQYEVYSIAREVIRNAFHHANAHRIEVEVRYDKNQLRVRLRDDGKGIDPKVLEERRRPGHWGLPGVRERAQRIGSRLDFWSEAGAGTEVELSVPAALAYTNVRSASRFRLLRKAVGHEQSS